MFEDGDVAVDVQDSVVLHFAPVEEFGEAACPPALSFFFALPSSILLFGGRGFRYDHGDQLDVVPIPRFHEELRVAIAPVRDVGVPFLRVEEDPVGFAAESGERLEDHDGVAEVGAVGCVLGVRVAGPVDVFVDEGGGVRGCMVVVVEGEEGGEGGGGVEEDEEEGQEGVGYAFFVGRESREERGWWLLWLGCSGVFRGRRRGIASAHCIGRR